MNTHTFHIPVMGIAYTIDTPLKVSRYGMDSVISLVDDILLEKLRKMYCGKHRLPYAEITNKMSDFRASRITSYLNLMKELAEKKFEQFKNASYEVGGEMKEYFNMLPDSSEIKRQFMNLTSSILDESKIRKWVSENLSMGSIDVNIMTKLDKENYVNGEKTPIEFNDAHAALRGYANSNLNSSIILSAGMSPRLYSYIEQFKDFYPNENGYIKKKIVLKVSDYRSAIIQGKFLAKKGLWVSEFRIESGLNCGGHAFATDGFLLGPILNEFKQNRSEMTSTIYDMLVEALDKKNYPIPLEIPQLKITAQGGVGTADEHDFLINEYELDSVGWGSPFLLVQEATNVDEQTLEKLIQSEEKDLYLSNISPLGIPFNNLKGNSKDIERNVHIEKDRPGSSCPKKFASLNTEFTDKTICTASRQYQHLKIKELQSQDLSPEAYDKEYNKVVEKSCICVGLGTAALLNNDLSTKVEGAGVSVCPGPNMAYFSKEMSLKEITDHIYGRRNILETTLRPNVFLKELNIYINYLKTKIGEFQLSKSPKQEKYLKKFSHNLKEGITYYISLFQNKNVNKDIQESNIIKDFTASQQELNTLTSDL